MVTRLNLALEDCLTRIELGELTQEECLAFYPDLHTELRPMLAAASRVGAVKSLNARPEFRARGRALLVAHVGAFPRRRVSRQSSMALRYATALAVFSLAFATAGTALAQGALPGDVLYPWKLASERLWRSVQQSRVEADLVLADRRVNELHAIEGITNLEVIGVGEYAGLLQELRQDVGADPSHTERVNETLLTHKEGLSELFANSQAELPDLEDLFSTITIPPAGQPSEEGLLGTELPFPEEATALPPGNDVISTVVPSLPANDDVVPTVKPTIKPIDLVPTLDLSP